MVKENNNDNVNNSRAIRVLDMYTKLDSGQIVYIDEIVNKYGIDKRSCQRDISTIRDFFAEKNMHEPSTFSIKYDPTVKGYRKIQEGGVFTNSEILAVCKILLDSRAFIKEDMEKILDRIVTCCVPKEYQKMISRLIDNEKLYYVEPRHKTRIWDNLWNIGQAIFQSKYIEMKYRRTKDKKEVSRKLCPVAIMFSEFYFYMAAIIDNEEVRQGFDSVDDPYPTIYRIDRITELKVLDERYHINYSDRFEAGQFRKKIQFMYGGKSQTIVFDYFGSDVDAVLDRLPTATILSEANGVYTIKAEVFGKGIDMWIRSQGDMVKRHDK